MPDQVDCTSPTQVLEFPGISGGFLRSIINEWVISIDKIKQDRRPV
jgi:hypothetical protein